MTEGFRNAIRKSSYKLDDVQRKKVELVIQSLFRVRVVTHTSRSLSDDLPIHALPSRGSSPTNSTSSTDPSFGLKTFSVESVKNLIEKREETFAGPSIVNISPDSILCSANVPSLGVTEQSQSGAHSRNEHPIASNQVVSSEIPTSPEVALRTLDVIMIDHNEDINKLTLTAPPQIPSKSARSSGLRVENPKRNHQNLMEQEESLQHANKMKELKHTSEYTDQENIIDSATEEDGDQLLASGLKAKACGRKTSPRKDGLCLSADSHFTCQSPKGKGSNRAKSSPSPTESFHAGYRPLNPKVETQTICANSRPEIFHAKDSLTTFVPEPQQRESVSRPPLSQSSSKTSVFRPTSIVFVSTTSEGANKTSMMKLSESPPRTLEETLPQRFQRSSLHRGESKERQEKSPQHQERPFQRSSMSREGSSQAQRMSHRLKRSVQPLADDMKVAVVRSSKTDDPNLIKSLAEIAIGQNLAHKPYTRNPHLKVHSAENNHSLKHVDFSEEECEELLQAWYTFNRTHGSHLKSRPCLSLRSELQRSLLRLSRAEVYAFIHHLHAQSDTILPGRTGKDVKAFISDLLDGLPPSHSMFARVELKAIDPRHNSLRCTGSLLRNRELGRNSGRHFRNLKTELQLRRSQNISPWRSWKGASGDVIACAWAPDSNAFAVGAAATTNEEDLQYNRPQNLLLGNLRSNTLEELPDHRIDRPKPETISRGPNSTQDVYNACNPMVYTTISALQFSKDGSRLYTASHDKTVKVWDVSATGTSCINTLSHDAVILDLDVANNFPGVFAAATKTVDESIHIYFPESDDRSDPSLHCHNYASLRATSRRMVRLYPECLRWGRTPSTCHLLLAGFRQWDSDHQGQEGEICLWNVRHNASDKVSPSSQSVYTATWHPTMDLFATGGSFRRSQALTHPLSTRSVVRTWDVRELTRYTVEYECPAIDMQDITFNPLRPNIVTAGCTDAATYIWDFRKPNDYLHKLQHGRPLLDWDNSRSQEECDTGVMMTVWGKESALLYTGSSDGIVKCWDVMRAPEDALVRDIADLGAGIQSGAFSPDFSHLLVGDSDGGVHVLSSAPVDTWGNVLDDGSTQFMKLIKAHDAEETAINDDDPGTEGIMTAKNSLASGRLVIDSRLGVSQGPCYDGPYAEYARTDANGPSRLLSQFEALQPFSNKGERNRRVIRTRRHLLKERRQLIREGTRAVGNDGSGGDGDGDNTKNTQNENDSHVESQRLSVSSSRKRRRIIFDDDDDEQNEGNDDDVVSTSSKKSKWAIVNLCTPSPPGEMELGHESEISLPLSSPSRPVNVGVKATNDENETSESEWLEEDHWWPRMDEKLFQKLKICV